MNYFLTVVALFAGTQTLASGYLCVSNTHNLNVKIYNHTQPEKGTSNGSIMVISDQTIKAPNSTVAVFRDTKGTLQGGYNVYAGKVDLRVKEHSKGEYLLGTRLGNIDHIFVALKYSHNKPVPNGAYVRGHLVAIKRNKQTVQSGLTCRRYLKN